MSGLAQNANRESPDLVGHDREPMALHALLGNTEMEASLTLTLEPILDRKQRNRKLVDFGINHSLSLV
jgi:hypothetical protein